MRGIIGKDFRQVTSNAQLDLVGSSGGITFTSAPNFLNGGTVQYKYHVFLSSSTFVSSGTGLVDILCVGGGGGGGASQSGGSSANAGSGGSVVTVISKTVSAGSYTVTVGAGGAVATNGGTSSVTGITGASAAGGALGLNNANGGYYLAGNGAGGNRGAAIATTTSAQVPGIGLSTDFFESVNLTAAGMSQWKLDTDQGLLYFGSGGVSGWADSGNSGANRGNAALGGGSGLITTSIFGAMGLSNVYRTAAPNTGGGGGAGLRYNLYVTPGDAGASGFVAIRYRI